MIFVLCVVLSTVTLLEGGGPGGGAEGERNYYCGNIYSILVIIRGSQSMLKETLETFSSCIFVFILLETVFVICTPFIPINLFVHKTEDCILLYLLVFISISYRTVFSSIIFISMYFTI